MVKNRRIFIWILRVFLLLILFYLLCLAGIYLYLQRDPAKLADAWLGQLAQRTGLVFEIGSIDVTLLPLPAMAISDVRVKGPHLLVSIAWMEARPTFQSLFNGDFFPGVVNILRPRIEWQTDFPLTKPGQWPVLPGKAAANPELPARVEVTISQLEAQIVGSDGYGLTVNGFNSDLYLRKGGALGGNLQFGSARLLYERKNVASLEQCRVAGETSLFAFFSQTDNLQIKGKCSWTNVFKNTSFGCELGSFSQGLAGRGRIEGDLDLEGEAVPFALAGWIGRMDQAREIVGRGLDWQLGPDSGSVNLTLKLAEKLADSTVLGNFKANRLSLTQWFGFARNLAPGLQLALDNITRTRLDFSLTAKSLEVQNIVGSCCGAVFRGKGGVRDFKRPIVALSLHSDKVNLGLGLPEAVGILPDAPYYPHPPLTPMPGAPLKPGETGIGYDIRLGTKLLLYGPLKIQNASLRVYPGKMDKTGLEDVLLDGRARFYGGTVNGSCILGADPSLPIHISARAANVNGASLGRDLPLIPIRQGKWEARATVTSRGKQLTSFLANLKGNIATTGKNFALRATGAKNIFASLKSSVQLRASSWNGRNLTMLGAWKGEIKDSKLNAAANVSGRIAFGTNGMVLRQLPGTLTAHLPQLPPGLQDIKITGNFSAQSEKNRFEANDARLRIADLEIRGNCVVDAARETAQGELRTEIRQLSPLLRKFGFADARVPAVFLPINLKASFQANPKTVKLSKINATLGQHRLSGGLGIVLEPKLLFQPDLSLNRLSLASFTDGKAAANPWEQPWLGRLAVNGKISISALDIYGLRLHALHVPLELAQGKLVATGITGNFYGAPLKGGVNANFQQGTAFTAKLAANGFDLGQAAKDLKVKAVLKGQASLEASANARLKGNMRLVSALNGSWNFAVKNGSWQGYDKNGALAGSATSFRSSDAAGTVIAGLAKAANFKLKSPDLNVTGGGWLNLVTEQVDCTFNVSMRGLPDFPLRLYGPLKDTKTSIGAGKMLVNAVGEVTSGFVEAIGGVFRGVWNIFRK